MTRGSGILLHFTSLPGSHGIGSLGDGADAFLDFLHQAGQCFWQFLPLGPTSPIFGNSPYMSLSAFAGNPLLIDINRLVAAGLLTEEEAAPPESNEFLVDFPTAINHKTRLLHTAGSRFTAEGNKAYTDFCRQKWLDEYAHFMALREFYSNLPWYEWPDEIRNREPEALQKSRNALTDNILYYRFEQFIFHSQWQDFKTRAQAKDISLIGDIPIYTALDSADVWAHQNFYKLDPKTGKPTHVAGVPPDYFSATGQRWGNPVYRWHDNNELNPDLTAWWQQRFRHIFSMLDIVRIDHFRGFESYWEIPAEEETAINGRWVEGPGSAFFEAIEVQNTKMPIIAEDLGIITPAVEKLRDDLGYPGMKILQFAFDGDSENPYLPHNYSTTNCVVYTGTHDNDTCVGWYLSDKDSPESKTHIKRYANSNGDDIAWDFIRLALSSVADLAIIPFQDLLGFGSDCRMNTPSTTENNWCWRAASRYFEDTALAARLRGETLFYNRLPSLKEPVPESPALKKPA